LGRAGYEFLVCVQNEKRKEKKVTVWIDDI
jgi:hypothetical protein